MKFDALVLGILAAVSIPVLGQEAIRVGDEVKFSCTRVSSGECGGRVEAINGNTVRVKWGNMRDQFTMVSRDQIRVPPKPDSPQTVAFQEAFRNEALNKYIRDLQMLAPFYDEQFNSAGGHTTMAAWQEMTTRLGELDALCKGKYAGITNTGTAWLLRPGHIDYRYADWCKIADKRIEYGQKARVATAKYMIFVPGADDLKKAFEDSKNFVRGDTQMLLYDPAKWKLENAAKIKPQFASYGVEMPADFFNVLDAKAAEFRAIVDRTAPAKTFVRPGNRDSAVEAVVKRQFAKQYPGIQILDIGGDYPKWEKREGADLIRSDTDVKIYKLTVNYYKRGYALVKIPNRPYCQKRSWIVRQAGMAADVASGGEFMKCQ